MKCDILSERLVFFLDEATLEQYNHFCLLLRNYSMQKKKKKTLQK